MSPDTIRNVIGIIGNVISFGLFLSPVPTFVQIWKKGSVEQFKPDPYLASALSCMSWVVYALPMISPNGLLLLTINGSGTVISFIYIAIFVFYSDKKQRLKIMAIVVVEICFIALLLLLVVFLVPTFSRRVLIVGIVALVLCVINYGAPLFVLIPNGSGALLGLVQLILYATFYKSTYKQIAERQAAEEKKGAEVDLSQVVVDGDSVAAKKTTTIPNSYCTINEA